jgi:hypothetical protein
MRSLLVGDWSNYTDTSKPVMGLVMRQIIWSLANPGFEPASSSLLVTPKRTSHCSTQARHQVGIQKSGFSGTDDNPTKF